MPRSRGLDEEWSRLDPIFVMGMQRSGTSIIAMALTIPGFYSFGEGHLWFELLEPFSRFRDPTYCPLLKRDHFLFGEGRSLLLEKYIALAVDKFQRDLLPDETSRWADKSPGAAPITFAPIAAKLFPKSQFIFVYRNGVATVNSGLRMWPDDPKVFERMCSGWAKTMANWRRVRGVLEGRFIEICQENIVSSPDVVAAKLTEFLRVPEHQEGFAELFCSERANTSFPDRLPGDYDYEIDWSNEQKASFAAKCGAEMRIWGYEMDSEFAGAPVGELSVPDSAGLPLTEYARRGARIGELELECRTLREHLARVERGRVMRLMTSIQRWIRGG